MRINAVNSLRCKQALIIFFTGNKIIYIDIINFGCIKTGCGKALTLLSAACFIGHINILLYSQRLHRIFLCCYTGGDKSGYEGKNYADDYQDYCAVNRKPGT